MLITLSASSAWACLCTQGDARRLSPPLDAEAVPINAHVFIAEEGLQVGTFIGEQMEWRFDPEPRATFEVEWRTFGEGERLGIEVWPSLELPSNTRVELVNAERGDTVAAFTTSDVRDDEPPAWGGDYEPKFVETEGCEPGDRSNVSLSFTFEGVEDAGGFPAVLLLEPIGEGLTLMDLAPLIGSTHRDFCGGNEAIRDPGNRAYEARFFDVAGNELAGGTVSACGCASTDGDSAAPLWALGMVFLTLRRRSGPGPSQ